MTPSIETPQPTTDEFVYTFSNDFMSFSEWEQNSANLTHR